MSTISILASLYALKLYFEHIILFLGKLRFSLFLVDCSSNLTTSHSYYFLIYVLQVLGLRYQRSGRRLPFFAILEALYFQGYIFAFSLSLALAPRGLILGQNEVHSL